MSPTQAQPLLSHKHHCPRVFIDNDGAGAEVDLWGVGELILQSKALGIGQELKDLGEWMQNSNTVSAQQALTRIKAHQSSQPGSSAMTITDTAQSSTALL